jgi:hypothetical protein
MGNSLNKDIFIKFNLRAISSSALTIYIGYSTTKYLIWRYKNKQLRNKGKKVLEDRNSRIYEFAEVHNEEFILSLDVTHIREELLIGAFTISDLVNVYGKRCYTIGRALNLTTDELFGEAKVIAAEKDKIL